MSREKEPIDRTHLFLYRSDIEWLKATYGDGIGVARAVRHVVRAFRQRVEAKAADALDELPQETKEVSVESLGV